MEIFERTGDTEGQAWCLAKLAWLLFNNNQLDAAEDTTSRAIGLISGTGKELLLCDLHRVLGKIFGSEGDKQKAIHHFEAVLRIASPFNWHDVLFLTHFHLAELFLDEGKFDDASAHVERAKLKVANDAYKLGRATDLQADVWYQEGRLEGAQSRVLHALEIFEKLGAAKNVRDCTGLLRKIERAMEN